MNGILASVSFFAVILVIYAVIRVCKKKGIGTGGEYDERQMEIRGRGYMLCCSLYMIEFGFLMFSDGLKIELPLTNGALYTIMFLLPIGVFTVYCIMNDAYLNIRNDMRRCIIFSAMIFVINAASTIAQIIQGTLIADGKLTNACITPAYALLFFAILVSLLIRNNQIKAEERSGDEES